MHKHGLLCLIKSYVVQMIHLVSSILSMVPNLVKITHEHGEINLTEVEQLKKILNDKEMALVEQAKEVK